MWARLIEEWRRAGHLGLTPSMLVGALRTPPGSVASAPASFADLRNLLESMRDERLPSDRVVRIFECQNIFQPVATLSSDRMGHAIARDGGSAGLFVWNWYEPEREIDFDWLLQALWCHFRVPICTGQFSYSRKTKQFHEFDDDDWQLIKAASRDEDE
jgi:hypothetical protein